MTNKMEDKDWLINQYITLEKSPREIGELCSVSSTTIDYWLKKFDIPTRSHSDALKVSHKKLIKLYKDKDWLIKQYNVLEKSPNEIAYMCTTTNTTINNWLKKHEIIMRSRSEAMNIIHSKPEIKKKMRDTKLGKNNPMYGKYHSEKTKKKMSDAQSGENNPNYGKFGDKSSNWKGGVGLYYTIHGWIYKHFSKPELCELCGLPEYYDKRYNKMEWSNKTGKLIKERGNWQYVHFSCHKEYDNENKIIHEGLIRDNLKKRLTSEI